MKTKEVLDKYSKILSAILQVKPEDLKFFTVKSIYYSKSMWNHMLENSTEIKQVEYKEPEKDEEGNPTGNEISLTRWNNWSEGQYVIFCKDELLASFELYKLPHCCAILVSCKAYVAEKFRNKRIGTILNNLRQDIGRLLGYSTLMCTDVEQNIYQRKLLATNGWKDIHEIKNKRTGNRVFVSVINL